MGKWHSQMVEVFNKNDDPYVEMFKDKEIVIPGRSAIKMRRSEAHDFIGTMSKPLQNGGWEIKMLEIRDIEAESDQLGAAEYVCNYCGYNAGSAAKLKIHLLDHKDANLDQDPERDAKEKEVAGVPECPFCGKSFETARGLQVHLTAHVNENKRNKEKELVK